MDFERWSEWSGADVASFVETFCKLPQYSQTIAQNLNGRSLKHLAVSRMLPKGLARAGVCDLEHQRRIASAVMQLESQSPAELTADFNMKSRQHPPLKEALGALKAAFRPQPPTGPRTRPGAPSFIRSGMLGLKAAQISDALTPRTRTTTENGLQRSSVNYTHGSATRHTPRPFEKADPIVAAARSPEDDKQELPPLQLRQRIARTARDFDVMRSADSPVPPDQAVVQGLRGVQLLQEENAALKIQSLVARRRRQKLACKEVQALKAERRQQSRAATGIQARYRQKAAAQEVEQMRTQRNQEIEATTKIQAVYRGKKGRAELAEGAGQEKIDAAEKVEAIQEEDEAVEEGDESQEEE
ncbi:unnamed protein product [Polarella glacialis]|uniref:SAM domain-containing protein n=1 Tax=Polarella glacialis TaxID=89957 RepID=A0A813EGU3_POLGL|nr:unnamed protein product [Polarella glacialis]